MSIELKNVDYIYDSGEPFEYFALRGISVHIDDGAFVGVVGRTGSGKSTLVEHLNGLLFRHGGMSLSTMRESPTRGQCLPRYAAELASCSSIPRTSFLPRPSLRR
jgi:energy-coupling factor transporter ATP-binding protein EcfA2